MDLCFNSWYFTLFRGGVAPGWGWEGCIMSESCFPVSSRPPLQLPIPNSILNAQMANWYQDLCLDSWIYASIHGILPFFEGVWPLAWDGMYALCQSHVFPFPLGLPYNYQPLTPFYMPKWRIGTKIYASIHGFMPQFMVSYPFSRGRSPWLGKGDVHHVGIMFSRFL
jgi:hypothetical protein